MVKYTVMFTAQLTNVVELKPSRSSDKKDVDFILVECDKCGATQQKSITVICEKNWPDMRCLPSSKMRCYTCAQDGGVSVIDDTKQALTDEHCIKGIHVPLMTIDCVGFTPIECIFGSGWQAETVEGVIYEDLDLSAAEIEDYDDMGNLSMAISQPCVVFQAIQEAKGKKWNRSGGTSSTNWNKYYQF